MLIIFQKYSLVTSCLLVGLLSCRQPVPQSDQPDTGRISPDSTFLNYNQGKFFPNIAFERFGVENGLPSGFIVRLMQDRQGFLWIATDNGLCRYDGHNFKTWQNELGDTTSLPSNQIVDFAEDSRGNLWLLLIGKGICCFNPDEERFKLYTDTLHKFDKINNYNKICLDKKDRIWLGKGYFDINQRTFVPVAGIAQDDRTVTRNADTAVFCLNSKMHTISKFEEGSLQFKVLNTVSNIEDWSFNKVCMDREGNIWAGTQSGHLYKFRPNVDTALADYKGDRTKLPQYSLGGTFMDFWYAESTDLLWIAQWGGLVRFDMQPGANPQVFRYRYDENNEFSLPDRVASCVLEDRSGVLWVGTASGGLVKFAPSKQRFQVFRKVPGDTTTLSNGNITAVFQDSKQRVWVGTKRFLNLIDLNTGKVRSFPVDRAETIGCNPEWVTSITEDPSNGKLVLTYWGAGFNWFDPKTEKFSKPPIFKNPKTAIPECWMFLQKAIFYSPDTLLLFEWGKPLNCYNIKTQILSGAYKFTTRGTPSTVGLAISALVDSKKNIWIGQDQERGLIRTHFGGSDSTQWVGLIDSAILIQPSANQFFLPNELDNNSLASGTITTLFEDSKKRLWVGTANGLQLLVNPEEGIFRRFGKRQGFADAAIAGILEDDYGMLWVSTNNGISRFDPTNGVVDANYNFTDGLPGNQFNMSVCFKNKRGEMFFGSTKGLAIFHPDSLGSNKFAPPVVITKIIADEKEIRFSRNAPMVDIPASTENLQIEFAALDYTRPAMNGFRYQLEGFEQRMSPIVREGKASYSNLSPGEYQFHVIARNNDDLWNKNGVYLTLNVKPEWHEMTLVRILAAAFLVIGIYLFVKWRERRIIREQQRRGLEIKSLQVQIHQAQMNPHFIFNVLTAIKHLIADKRQEEAAEYMDEFAVLIRRYLNASVKGDISQSSTVQNELPLSQEIELIDMYVKFEQLKYEGRFEYVRDVAEGLVPENISLPPMLLQPFVENAIKHGLLHLPLDQKGLLLVSFSMDDDETLRCTIEDNGVGLEESKRLQEASIKHYESHGVRLTNDRVKILNQIGYEIEIHGPRDREGGGTVVEITIA